MEYSCIFLDGWALWVFLAYLMCQFIMLVIVGNAWLKSEREHDKTKDQLSKLRHGYNVLLGKYQQATFKLPDVDTDLEGDN